MAINTKAEISDGVIYFTVDEIPTAQSYRLYLNNELVYTSNESVYGFILPAFGTYSFETSVVLSDNTETERFGPIEIVYAAEEHNIEYFLPLIKKLESDILNIEEQYKTMVNSFVTLLNFNQRDMLFESKMEQIKTTVASLQSRINRLKGL